MCVYSAVLLGSLAYFTQLTHSRLLACLKLAPEQHQKNYNTAFKITLHKNLQLQHSVTTLYTQVNTTSKNTFSTNYYQFHSFTSKNLATEKLKCLWFKNCSTRDESGRSSVSCPAMNTRRTRDQFVELVVNWISLYCGYGEYRDLLVLRRSI